MRGGGYTLSIPSLHDNKRTGWSDELNALCDLLRDGKEFGSIIDMPQMDWASLRMEVERLDDEIGQISFASIDENTRRKLRRLIDVGEIMAQKYDVVCTNPPYMGASGMNAKLSDYVKAYYPDSKSDMSTVCMERCMSMCKEHGYMAMLNIPVWMFLSSYEKLREKQLKSNTYISMVHPGRGVFGSDFGTTAFVMSKKRVNGYVGSYRRLFDKQGEVESNEVREQQFLSGKGAFTARQDNFAKIPGAPVAYWVSEAGFRTFDAPDFSHTFVSGGRNKTHNNEKYVRAWWEVLNNAMRWQPYSNGGVYRKWYGNNIDVVDWSPQARESYASHGGLIHQEYWNIPAITWNDITSGLSSYRIKPINSKYSSVSPTLISITGKYDFTMLAFLNSKASTWLNAITNPTMHTLVGNVLSFPNRIGEINVDESAEKCVELSQADWDSYETSWDFKRHPLL